MPAAVITRDDATRIRRNLERAGRPVPDALRNASEKPGSTGNEKTAPEAVSRPDAGGRSAGAGATPRPAPSRRPADIPRQSRKPRRSGRRRAGRALDVTSNAAGRRVSRLAGLGGGDGGGLLLAFWLYPLALAVLQQGAKGPGIWLRAKFLNQDETSLAPAASGASKPATPTGPAAAAPQPTYGGGGSTPARIY